MVDQNNVGEPVKQDESNEQSPDHKDEKGKSRSPATEYVAAVEDWLRQAYQWQYIMSCFPYYMLMNQQMYSGAPLPDQMSGQAVNGYPMMFQSPHNINQGTAPAPGLNLSREARQDRAQTVEGTEYRIPPLWKRFVAEFLDFLILFFLKLVVTFVAVDFFDFIDIDKYDFDMLQPNSKIDYKMALEVTSEIVLLEIIHRVVVCLFEALCLQQGSGRPGGATPGKSIMGLRVVLCDRVVPVPDTPARAPGQGASGARVLVFPATNLGFWWALCRSFVKNFILAFFFPICFTLFFFQHNRTLYDVLCRSIVIEDPQRR